jgi:hypothetical protein
MTVPKMVNGFSKNIFSATDYREVFFRQDARRGLF